MDLSALTKRIPFFAFTALTATVMADPPQNDISARIDALEAQVKQLKAERAAEQANQEQHQTTEDVLKDADHRSQLLEVQGVLAGYTNGRFILQSEDGRFLAHPWLQF